MRAQDVDFLLGETPTSTLLTTPPVPTSVPQDLAPPPIRGRRFRVANRSSSTTAPPTLHTTQAVIPSPPEDPTPPIRTRTVDIPPPPEDPVPLLPEDQAPSMRIMRVSIPPPPEAPAPPIQTKTMSTPPSPEGQAFFLWTRTAAIPPPSEDPAPPIRMRIVSTLPPEDPASLIRTRETSTLPPLPPLLPEGISSPQSHLSSGLSLSPSFSEEFSRCLSAFSSLSLGVVSPPSPVSSGLSLCPPSLLCSGEPPSSIIPSCSSLTFGEIDEVDGASIPDPYLMDREYTPDPDVMDWEYTPDPHIMFGIKTRHHQAPNNLCTLGVGSLYKKQKELKRKCLDWSIIELQMETNFIYRIDETSTDHQASFKSFHATLNFARKYAFFISIRLLMSLA